MQKIYNVENYFVNQFRQSNHCLYIDKIRDHKAGLKEWTNQLL